MALPFRSLGFSRAALTARRIRCPGLRPQKAELVEECAARTRTVSMAASRELTVEGQNVLGSPLECCCQDPKTGFYRDGFCRTGGADYGVHVVCSQVTDDFLQFTKSKGNDLSTPNPPGFPGLKAGDRWCLCAPRWKEALDEGHAPPVVLKATHARVLDFVTLAELKAHAVDHEE